MDRSPTPSCTAARRRCRRVLEGQNDQSAFSFYLDTLVDAGRHYLSRQSHFSAAQRGSGPSGWEENCTGCTDLKMAAGVTMETTRPGDSHSAASWSGGDWKETQEMDGWWVEEEQDERNKNNRNNRNKTTKNKKMGNGTEEGGERKNRKKRTGSTFFCKDERGTKHQPPGGAQTLSELSCCLSENGTWRTYKVRSFGMWLKLETGILLMLLLFSVLTNRRTVELRFDQLGINTSTCMSQRLLSTY